MNCFYKTAQNERAGEAAKDASKRPAEFIPIPYRDWFPVIRKKVYEIWNDSWQTERRDLTKIKKSPGKWKRETTPLNREEEVVLNRLRMEHTNITHRYLLDSENAVHRPICGWCNLEILTVKHFLVECQELEEVRQRLLSYLLRLITATSNKY